MKILGMSITPDFLLKLVMLLVSLGVMVQRVNSQADALARRVDVQAEATRMQLQSADTINLLRYSDLQQRLSRVENKLDQRP